MQALFVDGCCMLNCARDDGAPFQLRPCFQYNHMGRAIDADGSMLPEICLRVMVGAAAARPLRKRVLCSYSLQQSTRALLGEALVGCRLRFNGQAWLPLAKAAEEGYLRAIVGLYRDVTQLRHSDVRPIPDAEVMVEGFFLHAVGRAMRSKVATAPEALGPRS